MKRWLGLLRAAVAVLMALALPARAQDAAEIARETGVEAGLAVHVGSTDGRLETELAKGGRMLVHGLALDDRARDAARTAIAGAGLYGLAWVETAATLPRLPYADNLANLLVADADALGKNGPGPEEMARVVAPRGVMYLKQGGKWTKSVKPMPAEMDEWTHWDHGPDGNPVSRDSLVKPTNSLRWQAGPVRGMHDALAGMRLAGGKAVYSTEERDPQAAARGETGRVLVCRDAFSGVLLWKRPVAGLRNRFALVAAGAQREASLASGTRIFTLAGDGGCIEALDASSGQSVVRFEGSTPIPPSNERLAEWRGQTGGLELPLAASHLVVRVFEGRLLQAYKQTLDAFDAATGRKLWSFSDGAGKHIPWAVAGEGKVFAVISDRPLFPTRGSPSFLIDSIVALDAGTGRLVWRNRGLAGMGLFRLLYHDGHLIVPTFPVTLKGGKAAGVTYRGVYTVSRVRTADGTTVWKNDEELPASGHYQVALAAHDRVYVGNQGGFALDLQSGKLACKLDWGQYDAGCADLRGSPGYTFYGLTFIDRDRNRITRGQARSACDTGVFPAYGLLYLVPSHCLCSNYVNGHLALSADAPGKPVADGQRVQRGEAAAARTDAAAHWPAANEWPMHLANPRRGGWAPGDGPADARVLWTTQVAARPQGVLAADWKGNEQLIGPITAPTVAGDKVFVAVPDAHRLEALDARTGRKAWSFTAGARIDSPPTIYDGLCLFGCRDGWVYGLRASDGTLVWRFLAALWDKRIGVQSQLESAWPVSGSVMIHGGAVVCTAGRQSALDAGIQVYRLDPYTGRLLSKTRIWTDPDRADPQRFGYQPICRRIQDLLVSDGRTLHHTIDTLKDEYASDQMAELYPQSAGDRGGWLAKQGGSMTWVWANSNGFLGRTTDSQGRWDGPPMVYADLFAQRIVLGKDALYLFGTGRGRTPSGLHGYALDAQGKPSQEPVWQVGNPLSAKGKVLTAMIGANGRLYLAGHCRGGTGAFLQAHAMQDGKLLGEWPLPAAPLRDALAAAYGRLYVCTDDGSVIALGQ